MLLRRPWEVRRTSSSSSWTGDRILHHKFCREIRCPFFTSHVGLSLNVMNCVKDKVPWSDPSSSSLTRSVDLLVDRIETDGASACADLLQRCKIAKSLSDGIRIHHHMRTHWGCYASTMTTTPLLDLLLQMYCKCGAFETTLDLFCHASMEPYQWEPLSWSAVIRAYSMSGNEIHAKQVFAQLPLHSVLPGKSILATVFSVFADLGDLSEAKRVHACVVHSAYSDDAIVLTSIVSMYGKCGNFDAARFTFNGISKRDSASWDAMIGACSISQDVFFLFSQMQKERLVPTDNTLAHLITACFDANFEDARLVHLMLMEDKMKVSNEIAASLIGLYSAFGSLEDSQSVFNVLCNQKCVDSWNPLINAYVKNGQGGYALEKFKEMQDRGVQPDELTFITMLSVCVDRHSIAVGEGMHGRIIAKGFESSVKTRVALLDMYGRCGDLNSAVKLFKKFPTRTTEVWNAVMIVYIRFSLVKNIFSLFNRMQQEACVPNEDTYKHIFHACESKLHDLTTRKMYALVMFQSIFASGSIWTQKASLNQHAEGCYDCL